MRYLKWAGLVTGGLLTVLVLLVVILSGLGGMRINKRFDIRVAAVNVPVDAAGIERGRHFIEAVALCQECHGENYQGQVLGDDPVFGKLAPANLTSGRGGIGGSLTDVDYVSAIRHGVGRDGKAIFVMPSELYNKIGDEDLGAMIAYLKSIPPADNDVPKSRVRILARVIAAFDSALLSAYAIDHTATRLPPPVPGATVEHGKYLTVVCTLCHGEDFGGGFLPDDSGARAPNLTRGGTLGTWSEDDFVNTIRMGVTPGGNKLDQANMPWVRFSKMTDDELAAVWLHLRSVPPMTPGN